jgi:PAS domain S-box-containing protein
METCADPFVVYDNQGRATYLNPAFTEVFGWTAEEVLGRRIDFVPKESVAETQQAIQAVMRGEGLTRFESRRFTKDGKVLDVRIGGALFRDDSGAPEGIVVNLNDITAQKRMLAELEIARKDAEDANRAKSEFLANMSHEIRTPMNGIIGMTELALGTDLTAEQREYLEMAKMSADSLLALINDILDFSKIEAGKLELEAIDFNLRNTLENAADTLALKAHDKGLELACHIRSEVPTELKGDPGRLRQVIVNLAGNAIKFTERGEVVIRVEMEAEPGDAAQLHFMIADTGVGIPPERADLIFESFQQVDGSTTRKYGGTGLGLSISRQLVGLMGGKIWVESPADFSLDDRFAGMREASTSHSPGGPGSIFHFTARFEPGRSQSAATLRLGLQDLAGLPVLVVDDNYTNRMLLLEMLTAWGLVPEAAVDGKEALAMSEKAFQSGRPYRLVLLDMQMPEMDGFHAAELLKATPCGADMKIIMISSVGQRGDSVRCKAAGISGYLTKPVKQSLLMDAILMTMGLSVDGSTQVVTRHTVYEARDRLNILLAEDNVVNQTLAIKLLEARGHKVILANNGKEAVDAFQKGDIDLILMDIQMPEMDGFEATGHIRTLEQQSAGNRQPATRLPIVAMTAHAMKGDREKCLVAGMDDYVTKPIDPKALFGVIRKLVGESRGRDGEDQFPVAGAAKPPSPETFDLAEAMNTVLGDKALFQEVGNLLLEELPGYMARIRDEIAAGDARGLSRAAHGLKGAVGNFRAHRAYEAAYHLENLGKNGELDKATAGLSTLEGELNSFAHEMKTVLKEMANEDSGRGRR